MATDRRSNASGKCSVNDSERINLLESYCYCPSFRSTLIHGQHPKCKHCRYKESNDG